MKKIIKFMVVMVMSLSVVGCGNKDVSEKNYEEIKDILSDNDWISRENRLLDNCIEILPYKTTPGKPLFFINLDKETGEVVYIDFRHELKDQGLIYCSTSYSTGKPKEEAIKNAEEMLDELNPPLTIEDLKTFSSGFYKEEIEK